MSEQKVKLTKFVSVNIPVIPNFIIHEDGKYRKEVVPISLFSEKELKKVGKAWTDALIKKSKRKIK